MRPDRWPGRGRSRSPHVAGDGQGVRHGHNLRVGRRGDRRRRRRGIVEPGAVPAEGALAASEFEAAAACGEFEGVEVSDLDVDEQDVTHEGSSWRKEKEGAEGWCPRSGLSPRRRGRDWLAGGVPRPGVVPPAPAGRRRDASRPLRVGADAEYGTAAVGSNRTDPPARIERPAVPARLTPRWEEKRPGGVPRRRRGMRLAGRRARGASGGRTARDRTAGAAPRGRCGGAAARSAATGPPGR